VIQRTPTLFRPPHGQVTGALLRTAADLGMTTVLWSVDRVVPGTGTPAAVRNAMSATIQAGDIVCLHDGLGHSGYRPLSAAAGALRRRREVEIAALPGVLSALRDRGLHVGSVGDLQMLMHAAHPNAAG
jgi:peptidoglycan-N-acetylglucosamine deacetylase